MPTLDFVLMYFICVRALALLPFSRALSGAMCCCYYTLLRSEAVPFSLPGYVGHVKTSLSAHSGTTDKTIGQSSFCANRVL